MPDTQPSAVEDQAARIRRAEELYASVTVEPAATFDPGDHTVAEVEDYLAANPDQREAVLTAEAAGKNRTTLVGTPVE